MKNIDTGMITAQEAAARWGISDRRVCALCSAGKIPGAYKDGKSYKIPANAAKPADGRVRTDKGSERYLKWGDEVVGVIDKAGAVSFSAPAYHKVVGLYTHGAASWTPEQFREFLTERVVSRDRRDIERILFRMGLSRYDVPRIAEITRGIHPKDLLWIARSEDERLEDAMTDVFSSVFLRRIDMVGDSIDTPEGYNIKRYGVFNGKYGIFKQRISPLTTDAESEVAVSLLAEKLGVPVCPAVRVNKDTVFSEFLFDFSREYVVHFRRLFDGARSDNEYRNLLGVRPQYREEIERMILLDFITRQDDRHLSNIAVKVSGGAESFYALYDNGRSLFYEDTEEMVRQAVADPAAYATTFGYAGTYWDYVQEIAGEPGRLGGLINLEITEGDVRDILTEAGFSGYRFDGALEWILRTLDMVRGISAGT